MRHLLLPLALTCWLLCGARSRDEAEGQPDKPGQLWGERYPAVIRSWRSNWNQTRDLSAFFGGRLPLDLQGCGQGPPRLIPGRAAKLQAGTFPPVVLRP